MNERDKLVLKWPKILGGRGYPEVGDGWLGIIDDCCATLQYSTDVLGMPQVQAVQIKEKFGSLRFYADCCEGYQHDTISRAEMKSEVTCEVCGKPGKISGKYWLKATCEEHSK